MSNVQRIRGWTHKTGTLTASALALRAEAVNLPVLCFNPARLPRSLSAAVVIALIIEKRCAASPLDTSPEEMAWLRICIRWRLSCSVYFRRTLAHARRPYFIFMLGLIFVVVSMLSLHSRTGPGRALSSKLFHSILDEDKGWFSIRAEKTEPASSSSVRANSSGKILEPRRSTLLPSQVDLVEQHLRKMQKKIHPGNFKIRNRHRETNATYFRYRDLAAAQAERQERLRQVCEAKRHQEEGKQLRPGEPRYHEGWFGKKFLYSVTEVYMQQNFFFCPVLKVGSTFFRRLFFALAQGKVIYSPYDIPIKTALRARRGHPKDIMRGLFHNGSLDVIHRRLPAKQDSEEQFLQDGEKEVDKFLNKAGKVMFTREPYSKLLSAYVDKLFAPNPYFWKGIGRAIINKFRKNPSSKSQLCGHDVTFKEFIMYVIENEMTNRLKRDAHFVSSYDQCKPCNFTYDVIGKMETFSEDASLVVAQLGYNLSQSTLKGWSKESELDAIRDSVTSPYSWRRDIVKCITWEEANKRIWRKLQIRGILDRNESLPPLNFKRYSSNSVMFINLVTTYWEKFRKTGRKSSQKTDALTSAYSFVSKEELELLREYFLLDFDLFGYDSRPSTIFGGKRTWEVFDIDK